MYNETIRKLLIKMEALPKVLLSLYLMKVFKLSASNAEQSIYAACRNRICYKKGEFITLTPYTEINSTHEKRAKAFSVMIAFLPDSQEFTLPSHPWLMTFVSSNKMVQVCYIESNMEVVTSMVIAEKAVSLADRDHIRRIAIVENPNNIANIKKAGFSYFCTVSDDYVLSTNTKVPPNEAWADVADKK